MPLHGSSFPIDQVCSMLLQLSVQVEGVSNSMSGVASAVPQVIRRQSRGSQALQLARSLGSAGASTATAKFLIWSVLPRWGLSAAQGWV